MTANQPGADAVIAAKNHDGKEAGYRRHLAALTAALATLPAPLKTKVRQLTVNLYPPEAAAEAGEPLLSHLLTTVNIVNSFELGAAAVIAAVLSFVPNYYPDWRDKLTPDISNETLNLIDGLKQIQELTYFVKISQFTDIEEKNKQSEAMRKMLLAMVNDIRVVMIKLSMVTATMRYLEQAPETTDKAALAAETLEIFAPLANRLGIWQLKWELEDRGFQYSAPQEYARILHLVSEKRSERIDYIEKFTAVLRTELAKNGIACTVMGRPKHIYSIYRKMQQKNLRFEQLYDVRAVRVLVDTVPECYHTLGIVHSLWKPISGEFDDYISNPKPNDYQSLHTVVIAPENKGVEIQIRTREMHRFAEYGVAAHWRYKEGGKQDSGYEQKIAWLRQLLDWRENLADHNGVDLAGAFKTELFNDTIYVLTPLGKVFSLPKGATAIDFAYALHSDIGNRCRGAKVNGHIIPLSTPLENGQRVEIITAKEGNPSVNWLHEGWVKSPKAIAKIRSFIRKQNIDSVRESGKNLLDKELAKTEHRPGLTELAASLKMPDADALCLALGNGDVTLKQLSQAIRLLTIKYAKENPDNSQTVVLHKSKTGKFKNTGIRVNGESGVLSVLAKCCKPAPPDTIIGFITRGRGVSVHRDNCPNLLSLAEKYPEKVLSADWGAEVPNGQSRNLYAVDIAVLAQDRNGLLRDISDTLAKNKINVTAVQTQNKGAVARMKFTLEMDEVNKLPTVLAGVGEINDVFEVHRI